MATYLKLKGKLVETPKLETIGRKNTPKTTLKVLENHYTKQDGKWVVKDTSLHEIDVWGDKAVEAQALNEGDLLDFGAYENDKGKMRPRAGVKENTWEYQGKEYRKMVESANSWKVVTNEN